MKGTENMKIDEAKQTLEREKHIAEDKSSYYTGYIDGLIFAQRVLKAVTNNEKGNEK